MKTDKILHFLGGLISAMVIIILGSISDREMFIFTPVLVSLIIGFSKEMIDVFFDGVFDWKDLLATFLGGLFINLFLLFYEL